MEAAPAAQTLSMAMPEQLPEGVTLQVGGGMARVLPWLRGGPQLAGRPCMWTGVARQASRCKPRAGGAAQLQTAGPRWARTLALHPPIGGACGLPTWHCDLTPRTLLLGRPSSPAAAVQTACRAAALAAACSWRQVRRRSGSDGAGWPAASQTRCSQHAMCARLCRRAGRPQRV